MKKPRNFLPLVQRVHKLDVANGHQRIELGHVALMCPVDGLLKGQPSGTIFMITIGGLVVFRGVTP